MLPDNLSPINLQWLTKINGDNNLNTQNAATVVLKNSAVNQKDAFIKQQDKTKSIKKINLKKAFLIGLAAAGLIAGGIFLKKKFDASKIKDFRTLAKNIEFKPAETLDEAIRFGKEALGIEEYMYFTEANLDVVNWVNEGLVNTRNAAKGRVIMPKYIAHVDFLSNDCIAAASRNKHFLLVNSNIFGNLDNSIKKRMDYCLGAGILKRDKNGAIVLGELISNEDNSVLKSIRKFLRGEMSFNEKVGLLSTTNNLINEGTGCFECPLISLKMLGANKSIISKLEHKTYDEQKKYLLDYMRKKGIKNPVSNQDPFHTIYHEMGHLQDKYISERCPAFNKFNNPEQFPQELKDWLSNVKNMNTAKSVSWYATIGPGEFIAETYAKLVEGKPVSKDVMELYNKLNGPKI